VALLGHATRTMPEHYASGDVGRLVSLANRVLDRVGPGANQGARGGATAAQAHVRGPGAGESGDEGSDHKKVIAPDAKRAAAGYLVNEHDLPICRACECGVLIDRRTTDVRCIGRFAKRLGKHPTHVFSFRGRPIRQVSTKAWYEVLKWAGITDFRWHDLRHTWASWHVQNGTPLFALQELGGWESPEMVRRYAHLSAEHLAPYADRLCALRVVEDSADGTFTAQAVNEIGLA
jgi:hypothetical protein